MNLKSLKYCLILLCSADAQIFPSVSRKTSNLIKAVSEIIDKDLSTFSGHLNLIQPETDNGLNLNEFSRDLLVEFSKNLKISLNI